MARPKTKLTKQPLVVRSHTLSKEADQLLQQLSRDASDRLGWTISSSAVVRALLQYVAQQPPSWVPTTLLPLVEQEIARGMVWGRKRKKK